MVTGGDDLDDGLDLNNDYLAFSAADIDPASGSDSESDADIPADLSAVRGRKGKGKLSDEDDFDIESESEIERPSGQAGEGLGMNADRAALVAGTSKKRKAEVEAGISDDSDDQGRSTKEADEQKRKKQKMKDTERKKKRHEKSDPSAGQMSVEKLDAFYFANLRKAYPRASDMELADLRLPSGSIMSTASWDKERDLTTIVDFVQTILPRLPKNLKKEGTPSIIVLSLSGMRCADIVRALKTMSPRPPGEVAKLFAKHFKVSEQIEYLKKIKTGIVVGTPGRIAKILKESDALRIRQQTTILLDLSFHDPKQRTLLTINEIRDEFWKAIFGDPVVRRKFLDPAGVKFAVF